MPLRYPVTPLYLSDSKTLGSEIFPGGGRNPERLPCPMRQKERKEQRYTIISHFDCASLCGSLGSHCLLGSRS